MVARWSVDRLPLAQEGRDLDRAVRWRHRTTRCRFRLSACVDARRAQPGFYLGCRRHGSAVDSLERRPRRRRAEAGDKAGRAAGRAFEASDISERADSSPSPCRTGTSARKSGQRRWMEAPAPGSAKAPGRVSHPTAARSIGLGARQRATTPSCAPASTSEERQQVSRKLFNNLPETLWVDFRSRALAQLSCGCFEVRQTCGQSMSPPTASRVRRRSL